MEAAIAAFVWGSMTSGVTYDAIKVVLGGLTDKLKMFHDDGKQEEFNTTLETICLANQEIKEKLEELQRTVTNGGDIKKITDSFKNISNSTINVNL